jgi:hypothetical protein
MVRINGQTELRDIMQVRDLEALQSVHREIGARIDMLKRTGESTPVAHGDLVQFECNGNLIRGTVLRARYGEAWVKDFTGVVYKMDPTFLEKRSANSNSASGDPPSTSLVERRRA